MKTYKNIYEQIIDKDNLRRAFKEAAKGKHNRRDIRSVLNNLNYHVDRLHDILEKEEFKPAIHEKKLINDGFKNKKRYIIKPYYRYEQVVHHAIIQVLAPTDKDIIKNPKLRKIINRGAYEYTCGSVKNRGTHYGKRKIEKWIREDEHNTKYVLKLDIKHFFDSIPHDKLKQALRRIIKDAKTLKMLFLIIDFVPEGLPLGYYTSQWMANFYLQQLDHYLKQEVFLDVRAKKEENYRERMKRKGVTTYKMPKYNAGVKYMVRYMDDIVILGANKKELHTALYRLEQFVNERLGLKLKGNEQVFPLAIETETIDKTGNTKMHIRGRDIDFMGFRFKRNRTTLRKSIMIRATRKVRKVAKKKNINWYDSSNVISYMGYFKHTDTYRVYLNYIKPLVDIKKLKIKISKHGKKRKEVENVKTEMGTSRDLQRRKTRRS